MEVVIGTYEAHLLGYVLQKDKKSGKYELGRSFATNAHSGSVRSVASSWKYLVSGGVDEVIHIISMKHRIDAGSLLSHSGTVTALEFLRSAYLFSASEDGNICIWNSRKSWECEKVLRGHKDAVTSLSIHASGKLLLSVSKDRTLRTWNLVKGRCAYIINLKADDAQQVLWSTSGIYFAVIFEHRIDVYDVGTGGVLDSFEAKDVSENKRINKVLFANDNTLFVVGDTGEVVVCDLASKSVVNRAAIHDNRIKDIALIDCKSMHPDLKGDNILPNEQWLVTASSDGFIKILSYDFDNIKSAPKLITGVNTTSRPTCLTVWCSNQDQKFADFVVPEIKLPQEMMLEVRNKIKNLRMTFGKAAGKSLEEMLDPVQQALKMKTAMSALKNLKRPRQQQEPSKPGDDDQKPSTSGYSAELARKKAKISATKPQEKDESDENENEGANVDVDDDEDDEEAIRQMKADSKVLKEMNKYKKGKKKNITTFRQRNQTEKLARAKKFTTSVALSEKGDTGGKNRYFSKQNKSPEKDGSKKTGGNSSPFKQRNQTEFKGRPKGKKFTTSVRVSDFKGKGGKGFKPRSHKN